MTHLVKLIFSGVLFPVLGLIFRLIQNLFRGLSNKEQIDRHNKNDKVKDLQEDVANKLQPKPKAERIILNEKEKHFKKLMGKSVNDQIKTHEDNVGDKFEVFL